LYLVEIANLVDPWESSGLSEVVAATVGCANKTP
jgi:hypothetical protein